MRSLQGLKDADTIDELKYKYGGIKSRHCERRFNDNYEQEGTSYDN